MCLKRVFKVQREDLAKKKYPEGLDRASFSQKRYKNSFMKNWPDQDLPGIFFFAKSSRWTLKTRFKHI
jgi:hypothetical protein